MPLHDIRSVAFPYCIRKRTDGSYELLNREYKPLGFCENFAPVAPGLPIHPFIKGLTPAKAQKISYDGSADVNTIYLYNDGCVPTHSATNMSAYMKRLAVLAKLELVMPWDKHDKSGQSFSRS